MARKNGKAPKNAQEAVLTPEASQDTQTAGAASEVPENAQEAVLTQTQAAETASEAPENAAESAGLIHYMVSAPRGIYLRVGPGRAYHPLGVLENGTEVMGADLAGMLRTDRKPGETAWIEVTSKAGTGWVDSAFLERCF